MLAITSNKILEQINVPVEDATLDSIKRFGGYPLGTRVKREKTCFKDWTLKKELEEMELLFRPKKEESAPMSHKSKLL